ncbi:Conserved_hypothetical protein [Hexamita inflata]|uniref:Uncharacterized protein n=1 Tax=Hexamita inflata TaxID=28002 RepID=A0AA86ND51_9EUKA|nr:Conserved hypothetical protein [Hexamita inflata]
MDVQNHEINNLMKQLKQLEAECGQVEEHTQKNYTLCDKYEKKLTKLTIQNSTLQKQVEELNTNDKTQLQTALQLIISQTEAFEDELSFLKKKNQKLEDEIIQIDSEHQQKMKDKNVELEREKREVAELNQRAQQALQRQNELSEQINNIQQQIEEQNHVNVQFASNIRTIQQMREKTEEIVHRPVVEKENFVETIYQDLKEYSNDLIKLMVMAYESPSKFIQRGGVQSYIDILSRIERKKAQILYVQDK